jgi:hypothetical protein
MSPKFGCTLVMEFAPGIPPIELRRDLRQAAYVNGGPHPLRGESARRECAAGIGDGAVGQFADVFSTDRIDDLRSFTLDVDGALLRGAIPSP